MRWISRLTTTIIIVVIVGGAVLLVRSKLPDATTGGTFRTYALFRDASRLAVGSPVVIAGVRVGDITGLTIEGRFARVDMRLRGNINLPVDTFATRKADSLFGDSYIDLIPAGQEPIVLLKDGEPIRHVEEGGSTDATLRAIARAMPKIDSALDQMHDFMIDARRYVNGPVLERMQAADRWVADGGLERPLASADRAMESFERGSTSAAKAVADAAPNIPKRLDSFDVAITNARRQMKDAKAGLREALANAREGMNRVDDTLADLDEVTAAVDRGEGDDFKGRLGRLVNSPELANTLEDFTADAKEGAAGLQRFRSWVGGRLEVSLRTAQTRVYATGELYTRTDKFYLIEFSYSDLGGEPATTLTDAPSSPNYTKREVIPDKFRFTAQFGKRFDMFRLRGGVKDSTPGLGADALFGNGRLKLSADLFGSFDKTPRLKVAGALAVFKTIYIMGGVDDALNAPGELPIVTGNTPAPDLWSKNLKYGRDYFLGATLQFSDADLGVFLRYYGALLGAFVLAR